jgi:hypothetical protein
VRLGLEAVKGSQALNNVLHFFPIISSLQKGRDALTMSYFDNFDNGFSKKY